MADFSDTGDFDGQSAKRISDAVLAVERMQADRLPASGVNRGSKSKPKNAVMVMGGKNSFGAYPCVFVYLSNPMGTHTVDRWSKLNDASTLDCYLIIGHVDVKLHDVFDSTMCSNITSTDDSTPIFLFSDENYTYSNSNGPLNTVVFENDTNPRCEPNGTISVDRKYISITAPNIILMQYDYNPNAVGGYYIVGGSVVYSKGPPSGGFNSGPYSTELQAMANLI